VAPVAVDDRIYTNISSVITVQDSWLLKNDTDADTAHASLIITSAAAASGQSGFFDTQPNHSGTNVTFEIDISGGTSLGDGDSTSFDYVVKDPTLQDTGNVLVTYDTSGSIDGSDSDDILIGLDVGLHGKHGNDQIVGLGTHDLLDYSDVTGTWSLDLASGAASVDGNDTFTGIDDATGGSGANTISGNSGANILNGGDGTDTLSGNDGNDTLNGGNNNDVLNGGNDDDTLDGGAGNDALHGDGGNDWLHYDSSDSIVDGGTGRDVAILGTEGNFTFSDAKFASIEAIDLVNTGTTDVTKMSISAADVVDNNTEGSTGFNFGVNEIGMFVLGDNSGTFRDEVDLTGSGWSKAGGAGSTVTTSVFSEDAVSHTYDIWTNSSDPTHAIIAIEQGITVS
jgi:Ca2+-binding RTX toxin-like protein